MLVTWWTGSKRAKVANVPSGVTGGSFATRLLRSANAAHATTSQAAAPSLDDDTTQLVDDLCARLDERAARLEALLHDARSTIARLEALQSSTAAPPTPPSPPTRAKRAPKNAGAEPPLVEVVAQSPSAPRATQSPSDPLCARVYQLADSGADAVEIAKQLSEHTGKVQLILALRGQ